LLGVFFADRFDPPGSWHFLAADLLKTKNQPTPPIKTKNALANIPMFY
jgi:hypothetical protein